MRNKDGGPAFPVPLVNHPAHGVIASDIQGMTLRDYFAAHVIIDDDVSPEMAEKIVGRPCPKWQNDYLEARKYWAELRAILRGIEADAMLAEREKE